MAGNPKGLPVSEAAKLDSEIGERAQRLSAGQAEAGDFDAMHELVAKRVDLMIPAKLKARLQAIRARAKAVA